MCLTIVLIGWVLGVSDPSLAAPAPTATTHPSSDAVITYLNQTVDWYRRVQSQDQASGDSQETLLHSTLLQRRTAGRSVCLSIRPC